MSGGKLVLALPEITLETQKTLSFTFPAKAK